MSIKSKFDGANFMVTGGTGSFGAAFVSYTLAKFNPKKMIIYSRDEMKQWEMAKKFQDDPRVRFFLGDVRDKERLRRSLQNVDYVVHAAATKIVPTAEYNPFECIKTNVIGSMNLADACLDARVKKVVALSTDKASSPINIYGASKLAADKLFIASNNYSDSSFSENQATRFSVVRYGNVLNSRGSVVPYFRSLAEKGKITITDPNMTRFMITLTEGIELVWTALAESMGGEIFVKKIPSMKIVDIAKCIAPEAAMETIGIRPGEKIHEQMIGVDDARCTYDYGDHYRILPEIFGVSQRDSYIQNGILVSPDFCYSSELNQDWMSIVELKQLIVKLGI